MKNTRSIGYHANEKKIEKESMVQTDLSSWISKTDF